jgi:hypothetical protein
MEPSQAICLVPGALSREVERKEPEANHSFPFSVQLKNIWTRTRLPKYFRRGEVFSQAQRQLMISWTGRIVALLCTTADTWSHETVPCPFFSRPSKKQLRACGVFRRKVTVVKGSCLRAAEIENVAV